MSSQRGTGDRYREAYWYRERKWDLRPERCQEVDRNLEAGCREWLRESRAWSGARSWIGTECARSANGTLIGATSTTSTEMENGARTVSGAGTWLGDGTENICGTAIVNAAALRCRRRVV